MQPEEGANQSKNGSTLKIDSKVKKKSDESELSGCHSGED